MKLPGADDWTSAGHPKDCLCPPCVHGPRAELATLRQRLAAEQAARETAERERKGWQVRCGQEHRRADAAEARAASAENDRDQALTLRALAADGKRDAEARAETAEEEWERSRAARRQAEAQRDAAEAHARTLAAALEGTVAWIVRLAESGDAGFWNAEEMAEVIAARAALATPEGTPDNSPTTKEAK